MIMRCPPGKVWCPRRRRCIPRSMVGPARRRLGFGAYFPQRKGYCGELRLRYERLGRRIDDEMAKRERRSRPLLEKMFREYNDTLISAFENDCGWTGEAQLRGRRRRR